MVELDELKLSEWEREDLEDFIEDNPTFLQLSTDEMKKLKNDLNWKAQNLIDEAGVLENQAYTIDAYLKAISSSE